MQKQQSTALVKSESQNDRGTEMCPEMTDSYERRDTAEETKAAEKR